MSTRSDCFVSIVVRFADDRDIVVPFLRETHAVLNAAFAHYEIIVVDDGSSDDTVGLLDKLLKEIPSVRVLRLMRPFGYEAAIAAGLDTAIGDYIVLMDPQTDPPEVLPELVAKARRTNQVVFGVDKADSPHPLWYRLALSSFYRLSRLLGVKLVEDSTRLIAFNRLVLNAVTRFGDRERFFRLFATLVSGRGEVFEYRRRLRSGQPLQVTLRDGLGKAVSVLVQNSSRPLRLVSLLGVTASMVNLLYIGYVAAVVTFKKNVAEGWVTLSLQNAMMFFIINLTLAVIAEYVLRIMDESRDRPVYFVLDEMSSSVLIPAASRRNVVMESQQDEVLS